jgi:hypothetical protein
MKNYNKLEFCSVVSKLMKILNISEKTAFEIALNKAKSIRMNVGFIKIMPDAWEQYRKFVAYHKQKISFDETMQIEENQVITEVSIVHKI